MQIDEWATWLSGWGMRVGVDLSQARENDIIQVKFSDINTSGCYASNCSDIRITEGTDKEIPYQVIINGSTSGLPVSKFQTKNNSIWVLFRITNTSQTSYYIYYQNPYASSPSQFILVWEDDYESYATGTYPDHPGSGSFRGGAPIECSADDCRKMTVVSSSSQQGISNVSFIDTYGHYQFKYNMTNSTFWVERSGRGDNTGIYLRKQYNVDNGYGILSQNPCATTANGAYFCLHEFGGGGPLAGPSANTDGVTNVTIVANGTTIRVYDANSLLLSANDATWTQGDAFFWSLKGSIGQTLLSARIYNATVIPYNETNLTIGSEESGNQSEEVVRTAITQGIVNALGSSVPIYTDQQIYLRNATSDKLGTFDKATSLGNQTWAFNYITIGESFTNMTSLQNVVNVWENQSLTTDQITSQVEIFINQTRTG